MKLIIVYFLLAISITCNAQILTLDELQKLTKYNTSDFEDYVTAKGFKFMETSNENGCTWYDFSYSRNSYNNNAISFIDLAVCPSYNKVHHQFSDEKHYLKIKADAKSLGFSYINSRSENNTIISEFHSQDYGLL